MNVKTWIVSLFTVVPTLLGFSANGQLQTQTELSRFSKKDMGTIGFDTSTFFYRSSSRGISSTTVTGTLHDQYDSRLIHAEGDLQFYTFVDNEPQLSAESKELFVSTQSGTIGNHTVSAGRRYYEWSKVDHSWDVMSLWSPRFTWDQLHPQSIGMTGLFYSFESPAFDFVAYGSPISVPERGTPVTEKDGNIVSPNPFWAPLPSTLDVAGSESTVRYSLLTPSMQDILLRPAAAVKGTLKYGNGFWTSLGTGVLPVHMVQMAAEPYYDATGSGNLRVNIRPQLPMRNIITFENGFKGQDNDWDMWVSASYEQPFQFENQSNWLNPIITPTSIMSAGTNVQLTSNFWFSGSALFIHEQPFIRSSNLPDVNVDLPSRFPLKQGIKLGGKWVFSDINQATGAWTQDLIQQNHLVSLDFQHLFRRSNVLIGVGSDLIVTNSTKGWVGQYFGHDRLRGWLKYAF